MAPLDEKVVQQLEQQNVKNEDWTLYRDDGWLVLLGGMADMDVVKDILGGLHPNIKWEVNPRGPTAPPVARRDGTVVDASVLEHLDLAIHIINGRLETDLFAKDIPIYVSRRSCHPPAVFQSVAKAVATRLILNCSLERFLSPRIEEYSRYLLASDYSQQEISAAMREARRLDRDELIVKPRRGRRRGGQRKSVLVTTWDPRAPNISKGLKLLTERLYENDENVEVFPRGSVIPGFRRSKNVGEIIAPTKPRREARVNGEGGSCPCSAPRSCILHESGALQRVNTVRSRWDNSVHILKRKTTCNTQNTVYKCYCNCANPVDYVGSAKNGMNRRYSKHKSDIRKKIWHACGLSRHFERHHQGNMEEAISNMRVTLLDHLPGPYNEGRLLELEQNWMYKLGTYERTGCNSRLELTARRRVNYGNS